VTISVRNIAGEVDMPEDAARDIFDFSPIGKAIKQARIDRDLSREELAEMLEISEGYVKAIENTGKNPGFQIFWRLVTMFNISVDEYFYPGREPEMDTKRRQFMKMFQEIEARDVYLVESMVRSLAQRTSDENP
jgi:transcriptional regulator with XRE-family HTH domain